MTKIGTMSFTKIVTIFPLIDLDNTPIFTQVSLQYSPFYYGHV